MTPSTHDEYLSHLTSQLIIQAENPLFWQQMSTYGDTLRLSYKKSEWDGEQGVCDHPHLQDGGEDHITQQRIEGINGCFPSIR